MCGIATRPLLPSTQSLVCTFAVQVQVFLVLLLTLTGLAVLCVPVPY